MENVKTYEEVQVVYVQAVTLKQYVNLNLKQINIKAFYM